MDGFFGIGLCGVGDVDRIGATGPIGTKKK